MIPIPEPSLDDLPDEIPMALQGVTERLEQMISDLFSQARAVAEQSANAAGDHNGRTDEEDRLGDRRLYLPSAEGWQVRVKVGPPEYCGLRNPGEDWFHLIVGGELYLEFDCEKLCLNCALRRQVLIEDRLFWQRGLRGPKLSPITDVADGDVVEDTETADRPQPAIGVESTGSLE